MNKPIKLSRKQITEGLKQTPIENILLGAHNADKINLTKKQKDFARAVAEGKPKAQAYRENYNSKGKPTTEAVEGSKLARNPKVASMIEALKVANEAREYLIPAQIRTMAIQNLVNIAIDDGEKTSNKLKALELIGKMSEVQLFSERKEHIHLHTSADIKGKLLEGLRLAFSNSRGINDLAKRKAESLLIELEDARDQTPDPFENLEPADPLHPDPQISTDSELECLHSNPLKESSAIPNPLKESSPDTNLTITAVIVTNPLESDTCASIGVYPDALDDNSEGGGVLNSGQDGVSDTHETPPVNNLNEKA
jgi:hypothetical protein